MTLLITPNSVRWTRRAVIAAGIATTFVASASAEDLPWRLPKLRRIRVHDHHIAYYEVGSGPPLVLVHGGSGSPGGLPRATPSSWRRNTGEPGADGTGRRVRASRPFNPRRARARTTMRAFSSDCALSSFP